MAKVCPKCGEFQEDTCFFKCAARLDGLSIWCKVCSREYQLRYKASHPNAAPEYHKLYYSINREKILKRQKDKNGNIREDLAAYHREHSSKLRVTHPERCLWRAAKARAKKKGVPFSITVSDIVIPLTCPILGVPLEIGKAKGNPYTPSLDRIRPELGYIPGNIAVMSNRANTIKSYGTGEEHYKIAKWMEWNIHR